MSAVFPAVQRRIKLVVHAHPPTFPSSKTLIMKYRFQLLWKNGKKWIEVIHCMHVHTHKQAHSDMHVHLCMYATYTYVHSNTHVCIHTHVSLHIRAHSLFLPVSVSVHSDLYEHLHISKFTHTLHKCAHETGKAFRAMWHTR